MSTERCPTAADRFLKAKRGLFDRLYGTMNEKQREAVFKIDGPLLILAGAGTGKTTVLVNRIAFIVKFGNAYADESIPAELSERDIKALEEAVDLEPEQMEQALLPYACSPCPPWAVLSITFPNKAAKEMKERLERILGEAAKEIWAGTFHSVCVRILRRYGDRVGYAPGFTIYDTDDSKRVLAECLRQLNIDEKQMPIRTTLTHISRAKDRLLTPEAYEAEAGTDFRLSQIAAIYALYQKKLRDANALDFDDIIMQTVRLLSNDQEAREYYQNRFRYVCVDEYQDTNHAQFVLTQLLSAKHRNLMVVGDDDQSIYKFRGATIENILNFDASYKDAAVIKLEQNYRSTSNILDAANAVIRNNFGRRGKELWSSHGPGNKICVSRLDNQNEEARFIINKIMELVIREKRSYSDFAVLYRVNAQSGNLENIFAKSGVPYRLLGGTRFYDRKEIKDILAYLCIVNNPADNLRLKRIINEPKRKIGETTVRAIEMISEYEGVSMIDAMRNAENYTAISKSAGKLREFVAMIDAFAELSKTAPLSVLFERVVTETGYKKMLEDGGEIEKDRLQNVEELISQAVEYQTNNPEATLSGYLEEVALVSDIDSYDDTADAVVLMTIHSAKGLEFPVVFLPGMEEGIFPGMQAALYPEELEEERRLAYVAITRAKERLYALHVRERLLYGKTQYNPQSRFLTEIPEDYIENGQVKSRSAGAETQKEPEAAQPARSNRKTPVISQEFFKPSDLSSQVGRTTGYERFSTGDCVSHLTFGKGIVMSVKEMGADILYEIAFDKVGTKKLMATYAKLKKAAN